MTNERKLIANVSESYAMNKPSTYTIAGRKFVVTPVFHEDGRETFGSILMRLMQAEVTAKS